MQDVDLPKGRLLSTHSPLNTLKHILVKRENRIEMDMGDRVEGARLLNIKGAELEMDSKDAVPVHIGLFEGCREGALSRDPKTLPILLRLRDIKGPTFDGQGIDPIDGWMPDY